MRIRANLIWYATAVLLGILAAPEVNGQAAGAQPQAGTTPTPAAPQKPQPQSQAPVFQPQNLKAQPMKLQVIGKEAFCSRLLRAFSAFGTEVGYNPTQAAVIANGATTKLIQDFRSGRASDFLNSQALLAEGNLPPVPGIPGYLATNEFIGRAMGTSANTSLALSAGELRFIPHVPKGTDVIVVARNAAALTVERVNKIVEMARTLNIHVNVLWVGETNEDSQEIEEARVLAWIVAATGGKFINLGGNEWPCANML